MTASPSERPSPLTRLAFFAAGALVGGVIGYGFVSSGPGPAPSLLEPHAAAWVLGPAALVGGLAAVFTWRVLRRRFDGRRGDDA